MGGGRHGSRGVGTAAGPGSALLVRGLRRVQVRGFRSLRDVDLDGLTDATVLIGANGAGKSNLLTFLRMVEFINTGSLGQFVGRAGGAGSLLYYGSKRTREIEFTLEFEHQEPGAVAPQGNAYTGRLGFAAGDRLVFLDERVGFRRQGFADFTWQSLGAGHFESALPEWDERDVTARTTRWLLNRMNYFHFHDTSDEAAIRAYARVEDGRYLRSDGRNLAACLLALKNATDDDGRAAWRRIMGAVRQVAPFVKEISPGFSATDRHHVRLEWIDERQEVFGPHHLSDGTLRAIALITALSQPADRMPVFVHIDEPELGLHPAALALFCALVRSVSSRTQVMLATQSPVILDHFKPEEVVVVERKDGASVFDRLDSAALATWLEHYSLSEAYDKNLLGGRP